MREFTDNAGRMWKLDITVAAVKRVREATDVLLPALFDDGFKPLAELSVDYCKLVDVLWAACHDQAPEMTPDQFAEGMGGDSLGKATEALVRATADFFTSPEQRAAIHRALDTILETAGKFTGLASDKVTTILDGLDTSQLAQNCLDSVLSGQVKPELTQTLEPLGSLA